MKGKVITSVGPEVTSSNLHISYSQNLKKRLPQGTSDCKSPGEHNGALDPGGSTDGGKEEVQFEAEAVSLPRRRCTWLGISLKVFLNDIGMG